MGRLSGGTVVNPRTGKRVSWRPVGPVADEYSFYTRGGRDSYACLGVIGNQAHLRESGDHTPWSTHSAVVNGVTVRPRAGWVYAIDGRVPEPARFERWFLGRLRAGAYQWVKYWNILHRHWNRKSRTSAGVPFARASHSTDDHLHISMMPGYEYADSTILADYERYRTGGGPPTAPKTPSSTAAKTTPAAPPPTTPDNPPDWTEELIMALPTLTRGATGEHVRTLQGALCARGYPTRIDGNFGPATEAAVQKIQVARAVPYSVKTVDGKPQGDGRVGRHTWTHLLARP